MAATERLFLLLAAKEVTYGVPVVPALNDARAARDFADYDPEFGTVEKMWTRPARTSGGKDVAAIYRKIDLEWPMSGPGVPGGDLPAPRWGIFMEASEMVETNVGVGPITGHIYAFASRQNQTSLTMELYEFFLGSLSARKIVMAGARLAWEMSIAVNEPGLIKFTGCALFLGAPTERLFTETELDVDVDYGDDDEQCDSANGKAIVLTIGGVSLNAKSISLKTNRKVETQEAVTASQGIAACYVTADKGAVFDI